MNLYDKNIDTFRENIRRIRVADDDDQQIDIELLEYDNRKEKEMFNLFVRKYKITNDENILEELQRLCECEVIFARIWSLERNELFRKVTEFELNSVQGASFLHEFVKQIQLGQLDYFEDLVSICAIKYFKTSNKAERYFDMLIERVKNTPGLDVQSTLNQKEKFSQIFKNYKSLYTQK